MSVKNLVTKGFDNIQFRFTEDDRLFFTSDTHFFHNNIIRFCNRPFKDVNEMNDKLVENWNSVVGEKDIVFHLGDFCWGGAGNWTDILDRLNGKIYLILGNHDIKNLENSIVKRFTYVTNQMQIRVGERHIYLNHYPFLCYGGAYRDVIQLFGHVHSGTNNKIGKDEERLKYLFPLQYDVGVDNNDYTPISYKKVMEIIEKQKENSKIV